MQWLTDTYGGVETYRSTVETMRRGAPLTEALETVTGKTLLELENEWRAFLNVSPVPEDVLDPGAALDDPADPYFMEDESVVLSATPLQPLLYSKPSTVSIANRTCFANTPVTILRAGSDGTTNWYEVDCMGLVGWMNQSQLAGPQ